MISARTASTVPTKATTAMAMGMGVIVKEEVIVTEGSVTEVAVIMIVPSGGMAGGAVNVVA
jgi:hypothetical protein